MGLFLYAVITLLVLGGAMTTVSENYVNTIVNVQIL